MPDFADVPAPAPSPFTTDHSTSVEVLSRALTLLTLAAGGTGLALIAVRVVSRNMARRARRGNSLAVRVVETQVLEARRRLHLVHLEDRWILIGSWETGLTALAEGFNGTPRLSASTGVSSAVEPRATWGGAA